MKNRLLYLLSIIFIIPFIGEAQDSVESYIELKSGEVINGKVEIKNHIFTGEYLTLNDTVEYKLDKVRSFQNNSGYFVVFNEENSVHYKILKREKQGKIDIYSLYNITYSGGYYTSGVGGVAVYHPGSTTAIDFYMKNGVVKEADYGNLKIDLSDNKKSMGYLKTYNRLTYVQWGLFGVGAVMIISAMAQIDKDKDFPKGQFFGGGAVIALGLIPSLIKSDKIDRAVRVYNEE